jgi:hypothetical protein
LSTARIAADAHPGSLAADDDADIAFEEAHYAEELTTAGSG